jgi:hypothetical protein
MNIRCWAVMGKTIHSIILIDIRYFLYYETWRLWIY